MWLASAEMTIRQRIPTTVLEPLAATTFFAPTTELRKLVVLAEVANGEARSQRDLAGRAGTSVSVANQYLSVFSSEGWISRHELNRRDCEYRATLKGAERVNEQLLRYVREIFVLFNHARREIARHLSALLAEHESQSVIVYPAGAVGELILHVLENLDVPVVAVVDDDLGKLGSELLRYRISASDVIRDTDADAVLIATYRYKQQILDRLEGLRSDRLRVISL